VLDRSQSAHLSRCGSRFSVIPVQAASACEAWAHMMPPSIDAVYMQRISFDRLPAWNREKEQVSTFRAFWCQTWKESCSSGIAL